MPLSNNSHHHPWISPRYCLLSSSPHSQLHNHPHVHSAQTVKPSTRHFGDAMPRARLSAMRAVSSSISSHIPFPFLPFHLPALPSRALWSSFWVLCARFVETRHRRASLMPYLHEPSCCIAAPSLPRVLGMFFLGHDGMMDFGLLFLCSPLFLAIFLFFVFTLSLALALAVCACVIRLFLSVYSPARCTDWKCVGLVVGNFAWDSSILADRSLPEITQGGSSHFPGPYSNSPYCCRYSF